METWTLSLVWRNSCLRKRLRKKISDKVEEKKPAIKKYLVIGGIFGAILIATGVHCYHEGVRDGMLFAK